LAPWAAALAGHAIEKNARTTVEYQIIVRYEDRHQGHVSQATPPSWRAGDKVKVINGMNPGTQLKRTPA